MRYTEKINRYLPKRIQVEQVKDHIEKLRKYADYLITMGFFLDSHLHPVRKTLKDIYHLSSIFKSARRFYSYANRQMNDSMYQNPVDDLGSFHDICTSIALIGKPSILCPTLQKEIGDKWKKEKLLMKKVIVEQFSINISTFNFKRNRLSYNCEDNVLQETTWLRK